MQNFAMNDLQFWGGDFAHMGVVRLMASAIADEARDIEQSTAPKQKQRRAVRSVPISKPPNVPKFPQSILCSSNSGSPTHTLSNP
jgi:hypothetical protein